jgi:hypothetical protein
LVLIDDAEGRGIGAWSGEGNKARIESEIRKALEEGRTKGTLATTIFARPNFHPWSR